MVKKLLLITPPYHAGVVEAAGSWPHIGFVYIAGHARAAGFDVEIYDAMIKGHSLEQIKGRIKASVPDFVGSTAYTSSINDAIAVLQVAKEVNPKIFTLLGGIHANFCYEDLLRKYPDMLDIVVRGEGEVTVPELMQLLSAAPGQDSGPSVPAGEGFAPGIGLNKVLGIAYRENGQIRVNPPRPFIEDLDSLIPAWDLVDWEDYSFYVMPGSRLGIVNSSRGCVNECSFCSQQKLYLLFETCVGDIIRDADIMWKYREAGVLHIYVGVEATSQDKLDHFKKNIACEQSKEAIRLINDAGMLTECSFVLGMPDDTPEHIEETMALAKHYNPDFAHFLLIAPWPYADIYEELKDYVVEKDFAKYNFVEPVIKPKHMTMEEISRAVINCYRRYYMDKVKDYDRIRDEFKRDYLLRSMKVMMENSFLVKHITGMGEIPEEVRKYLDSKKKS